MTDATPRPCRKCGATNVKVELYMGTYGGFFARVVCRVVGCEAEGPLSALFPTADYAADEALRRWNTRAEDGAGTQGEENHA